eukprot:gnl/Trimastix_PCT/3242.p1 GENE.gnl/Trimastix_PCT/3242~~gnl/Trimastix_PCT/3242.p1  ORF type:complete len:169 (+),score=52.48 gnl/Trimastix_PCT/3242:62-508(+)
MDAFEDHSSRFASMIYKAEIDRVNYVVRSYLRTRLHKIQRFVEVILGDEEARSRLSPAEERYALRYVDAIRSLRNRAVLEQINPEIHAIFAEDPAEKDRLPAPNPDAYVFCVAKEPLDIVQPIEEGKIFVTRYCLVRSALREDKVCLV